MKRYSGIYGELLSITDENTILKIYEQNYGVQSIQEISRYLNLSSRRVMQIAKEEGVTKAKTNAQEEIY